MPVWQCTTTFPLGWVWPRETTVHSYQLKGSTCPNEVDPSDIGQRQHVLCDQSWFRNKDVSLLQLRGDGWMYRKRRCMQLSTLQFQLATEHHKIVDYISKHALSVEHVLLSNFGCQSLTNCSCNWLAQVHETLQVVTWAKSGHVLDLS